MENNYFVLLANDVKKLWNSIGFNRKPGLFVLIVLAAAVATFFLFKAMSPDWAVLYSDLNEVSSMNIVDGMKKNGYRYKVSGDHKTIFVPANVREDMRIFVAENDLIKDGEAGLELSGNMQFGSNDFKNKLTGRKSLQSELTRSIEKIQGVKSARVQLAESDYDNDVKPSASVVLVLERGYEIKYSQVKAIKNLVAYAISGMTADNVFITDQNGNSLSDETSKNPVDMEIFKSNFEKKTAKKVSDVLEKIVGKGNVSVQVNADIDFNSTKATIESYIPLNDRGEGIVTSSRTEVETSENPNNLNKQNLNYSKQKTEVNYNVSKEVKQIVYAPGTVKRLSIAVAVNKILTNSEKEELRNLVLSAAGADYSRGDVITVSGLQFEGINIDKSADKTLSGQYQKDQILYFITSIAVPLIAVLILGCFALFILKNFAAKLTSAEHLEEAAIEKEKDGELEEEMSRMAIQSQKEQNINELNEAVMASPEEVAKLITSYIKND